MLWVGNRYAPKIWLDFFFSLLFNLPAEDAGGSNEAGGSDQAGGADEAGRHDGPFFGWRKLKISLVQKMIVLK